MHLRRALLLMGLVLLVAAAVESLAPVPRERSANEPAAPPAPAAAAPQRSLEFTFPRAVPNGPTVKLAAGTHASIEVRSSRAGQVTLAGLGLSDTVEPSTPATFDVLAGRPGAYDVRLAPIGQAPLRVGRVVVK